jgi:DNA processing protein
MSPWQLRPADPRWPQSLDDLAQLDPPLRVASLWVEGDLPELPGVAIVGARRATMAGQEAARRIGGDLARRGVTVVSGFARGVDFAAHQACLSVRGHTVAVLGCGLDVDYPPQNSELRRRVGASGALISEYALRAAPLAWHFPHRNRIIAALARAVIVVEAGSRSGALSTARWAADLGREILAVPGPILGPSNEGSNRLLRDGARPYLDISDLADVLPSREPPVVTDVSLTAAQEDQEGDRVTVIAPGRSRDGSSLLALLGTEPVHREVVTRALGLDAAELAVLVGEMELAGDIRSLPGGLISRSRW